MTPHSEVMQGTREHRVVARHPAWEGELVLYHGPSARLADIEYRHALKEGTVQGTVVRETRLIEPWVSEWTNADPEDEAVALVRLWNEMGRIGDRDQMLRDARQILAQEAERDAAQSELARLREALRLIADGHPAPSEWAKFVLDPTRNPAPSTVAFPALPTEGARLDAGGFCDHGWDHGPTEGDGGCGLCFPTEGGEG